MEAYDHNASRQSDEKLTNEANVESQLLKSPTELENILNTFPVEQPATNAEWTQIVVSLGRSALYYPFDYAKSLIQLGYEPIPPRAGVSMFGKPTLYLPNVFQYTNYIRKVDGFWGCYRGLSAQLTGVVLAEVSKRFVGKTWDLKPAVLEEGHSSDLEKFKIELRDEIILTTTGVIVMYPFRLISIRMMSEFIGGENIYNGIFSSIKEIFQTEGILGFFNGIIPRLLSEVGCLFLASTTAYMVNKYILKDKVNKMLTFGVSQYMYAHMLYPLNVTSTCMMVSGSRLAAGRPPIMPVYKDWKFCLRDLRERGEMSRGNSMVWRCKPAVGHQKTIIRTPDITYKSMLD